MAVKIDFPNDTGKTLFATLHQLDGSGSLGDTWDVTAGDWASGVAVADAKISMTEQSGYLAGLYYAEIATTLGTYTGRFVAVIHDDNDSDKVVGSSQGQMSVGDELDLSDTTAPSISALDVDRSRTWKLRSAGEYSEAPEIIELTNGTTATLAMDFAKLLNPGTDLSGTPTIVVDTVASGTAPTISSVALSQDRLEAHGTFVAAVAGSYKIKVTATTTDSQTFTGFGWLRVN